MCPLAPIGAVVQGVQVFDVVPMTGQASSQWAILQPMSADKAALTASALSAVAVLRTPVIAAAAPKYSSEPLVMPAEQKTLSDDLAVQAMQAVQRTLSEALETAVPTSSNSTSEDGDGSEALAEDGPAPPYAMTRAARRRMRQRANKKLGKSGLAAKVAAEAEISTTDDEMFFHKVDLPLPQKGCAPRKAPAMDVPLIATVDAVGKVQGMPTCPTFALGGLKSVPVCAYPIVQKLPSKEVPEVAVDTFVMGSSKKDSPAELPLRVSAGEEKGVTTLANIAGVSVKNTFLHFDFAAPSERGMGSRRRANSC